jgi:hypothetical protein
MKLSTTIAIAALALSTTAASMPSASACACPKHVVRRHHTAMRTITRTRVVERTILQPAVVQESVAVPMCQTTLPVVTEQVVAVPWYRRHHHLLGVSTPIFGFHIF